MNYAKKIILSTVIAVVIAAGCDTTELQDFSINPQAVNQINLNFFFTPAQLGAASGGSTGDNRYIDWRTNIGMCSYAIQHLASVGEMVSMRATNTPIDPGYDQETSSAPFVDFV